MGLFDLLGKQFIDVIQWVEDRHGVLAFRYPMADQEIQSGAHLVVRETQWALLVDEGHLADQFGAGTHTLDTQTLPILTSLRHWDALFESPFKSDIYFFSARLQLARTWGTSSPVTLRDEAFGVVRLRGFGQYSYRIADPRLFFQHVSGTCDVYTVDDLDEQLRGIVVAGMSDVFAESGISFIDMAAHQDELAARLRSRIAPEFIRLGLLLDSFTVQNLSLPDDLQKILDERIGMNIIGDLGRYTQFQAARSLPLAAANEGGVAGAGAGIGAGVAMGQWLADAVSSGRSSTAAAGEDVAALIEKLQVLKVKGILTETEFDDKKAELLKKLV
ncbi:MAG: SPFH domain-containing protein [Methylococcaceae bacterium]|jgi:membrane protease subunit (stomatin/prohibitin family)